jgi:hypothetical protein
LRDRPADRRQRRYRGARPFGCVAECRVTGICRASAEQQGRDDSQQDMPAATHCPRIALDVRCHVSPSQYFGSSFRACATSRPRAGPVASPVTYALTTNRRFLRSAHSSVCGFASLPLLAMLCGRSRIRSYGFGCPNWFATIRAVVIDRVGSPNERPRRGVASAARSTVRPVDDEIARQPQPGQGTVLRCTPRGSETAGSLHSSWQELGHDRELTSAA